MFRVECGKLRHIYRGISWQPLFLFGLLAEAAIAGVCCIIIIIIIIIMIIIILVISVAISGGVVLRR